MKTELFRYAFWSLLKVFERFCNEVTKDVTTFLARFASACPRLGLVLLYWILFIQLWQVVNIFRIKGRLKFCNILHNFLCNTLVMSWVKASICCSSFIESSNVGLRRCLFWRELNSLSRVWIFVKVYWASSKLSVHSGGILTWVAWLLPWTSTSWRTKESVSDML